MRSVPIGASLYALTQHRYPIVMVEGPRGTSKTRGILTVLMRRAMRYPGSRILLARQYRTDLTKTVLLTLEEEVFPSLGIPVPGGSHRQNRSEYVLSNGSVLFPVGIADGMGILSMGMTFAYAAEVIEMSEATVTDILGSMRWMRQPERPLLPAYTQVIMDCNPSAPGHWANQRSEKVGPDLRRVATKDEYDRLQRHNYAPAADPVHVWKRIITKHQDNPGYWDHKQWDWTELGRKYVTETLEGLTGHKRRRWLDGDWVSAEGTVYPEFDDTRHVCTPFTIPNDWPQYVGVDPGYDHPCAILWLAVAPNGVYYVCDELYRGGKSIAEHAADIHARNTGRTVLRYYADPQHAFSRTAQSPRTIADQFREAGLQFVPWPRTAGNEESMVEVVRQRLRSDRLRVFSTCPNLIREFQSWSYKRTASGELPPGEDRFEDKDNDALDVLKGLVNAHLPQSLAGGEVRVYG